MQAFIHTDVHTVSILTNALPLCSKTTTYFFHCYHLGSRLPYYISDYMTKGERSEQDQMWQDIFSSAKSLGTNAMAFLLKSVPSHQVGAHEAVDRPLGHKITADEVC